MNGPRQKESEIGPIGADWELVRLHEVAESPQYGLTASAAKAGNTQFLRITDIEGRNVNWTSVPYCDCPADDLTKYRLASGDIVFARIGATTGKTAFLVDPPNAVFASYLIRVRAKPGLDPEFLSHFLQSQAYWIQIDGSKHTNLKKGVNGSLLKALLVPKPPLSEQCKIARLLSSVQRAIERQERLIALTTELKKALMHKLFTEGTRGEPLRPNRFGMYPASWLMVPLGDCCEVQTGIAKGRAVRPEDAVNVPYLRVANVQDGHLNLSEMKTITIRKTELGRFSLRTGDVVLTEGGDLDKLGRGFIWNGEVARCVHQNHVFAVRPDLSKVSSDFIAYQTQSPYGKAYFLSVAHKTTNLACINTSKLKAFPVLLPTKEEQKEIIRILRCLDRRRDVITKILLSMQSLFYTLLNQLMTAQVRVHDLDLSPLDELEVETAEVR